MFEILEHMADIGFRARSPSLPELFESAAEALAGVAMETENIEPRESYRLAAEGDSTESLLVNWLSEVLYYIDGEHLALRGFKVLDFGSNRVQAEAHGERRDPARSTASDCCRIARDLRHGVPVLSGPGSYR